MSHLSIVTTSLEAATLPSLSLRQKADLVPPDATPALIKHLVGEMLTCLYTAGGVGLAAPQVGLSWRMFLAMERSLDDPPLVVINPVIKDMSDEIVAGREGCLSLPGYVSMKVPRSQTIQIEALNQFLEPVRIEATGFLARVLQHEYDHLDGVLYIDRLQSMADLEFQTADSRARTAMRTLFNVSPAADTDTPEPDASAL